MPISSAATHYLLLLRLGEPHRGLYTCLSVPSILRFGERCQPANLSCYESEHTTCYHKLVRACALGLAYILPGGHRCCPAAAAEGQCLCAHVFAPIRYCVPRVARTSAPTSLLLSVEVFTTHRSLLPKYNADPALRWQPNVPHQARSAQGTLYALDVFCTGEYSPRIAPTQSLQSQVN